jgi:hypothetical protein
MHQEIPAVSHVPHAADHSTVDCFPLLSPLEPGRDRIEEFRGFPPSWAEAGDYQVRRYVLGAGDTVASDWVRVRLGR